MFEDSSVPIKVFQAFAKIDTDFYGFDYVGTIEVGDTWMEISDSDFDSISPLDSDINYQDMVAELESYIAFQIGIEPNDVKIKYIETIF